MGKQIKVQCWENSNDVDDTSNLVVDFNGHQIKPESSARFRSITISDDLAWDKYSLEDKNSLLPEQESWGTQVYTGSDVTVRDSHSST